jgi:pimeloyl-ACP methyl ester carboxylesterase
MVPIVFAQGLEGSPDGTKIQWLKSQGFEVIAPDGRGMVLADRLHELEVVTRCGGLLLAGSSYGGLAAAWLAMQYPERFESLLLLAPALHHSEPPVADAALLRAPAGLPTIVIHGVDDQVVPIDVSRRYCRASDASVELLEVEDGHRLTESLAEISDAVHRLLKGPVSTGSG